MPPCRTLVPPELSPRLVTVLLQAAHLGGFARSSSWFLCSSQKSMRPSDLLDTRETSGFPWRGLLNLLIWVRFCASCCHGTQTDSLQLPQHLHPFRSKAEEKAFKTEEEQMIIQYIKLPAQIFSPNQIINYFNPLPEMSYLTADRLAAQTFSSRAGDAPRCAAISDSWLCWMMTPRLNRTSIILKKSTTPTCRQPPHAHSVIF